jgi:hypothetical protein
MPARVRLLVSKKPTERETPIILIKAGAEARTQAA